EAMLEAFQSAYMQRFSFLMPDRPLVIDSVVAEAIGNEPIEADNPDMENDPVTESEPETVDTVSMYCEGEWRDCPLYEGAALQAGHVIYGPAMIIDANAT